MRIIRSTEVTFDSSYKALNEKFYFQANNYHPLYLRVLLYNFSEKFLKWVRQNIKAQKADVLMSKFVNTERNF